MYNKNDNFCISSISFIAHCKTDNKQGPVTTIKHWETNCIVLGVRKRTKSNLLFFGIE